eukprot:CAMPEP_0178951824 /NCGR_PEP_ID=MMETSP0789-20121207/7449_1 /TAXON_ID=3005 /ORGANISM="Rhizosolenia setigera, Strain CCMP 1694" /LENGTH=359 /DNA_ID=CAMNT_0020632757 /DNA_START=110 /DNA_END=1189 /DNA_ORIENTATION=+
MKKNIPTKITSKTSLKSSWQPLQNLMNTEDLSTFYSPMDESTPQIAKDHEFAHAVITAWKADVALHQQSSSVKNMGCATIYKERCDDIDLHGYLVAPSTFLEEKDSVGTPPSVPAILLFHTGAGPQDIFLRWKADILARELNCVVLIADIIGDPDGYAWTNREKYAMARNNVLKVSSSSLEQGLARWTLRRTIAAAINHVKSLDFVKIDNIAALGYCFGGHPILELGLMQEGDVKALISYHGVFDGVKDYHEENNKDFNNNINNNNNIEVSESFKDKNGTKVLICNGMSDPFVQQNDINAAKLLLEKRDCDVEILNFENVKHGFTNPAQDYNPSDAFSFDENAAKISWEATIDLLKRAL